MESWKVDSALNPLWAPFHGRHFAIFSTKKYSKNYLLSVSPIPDQAARRWLTRQVYLHTRTFSYTKTVFAIILCALSPFGLASFRFAVPGDLIKFCRMKQTTASLFIARYLLKFFPRFMTGRPDKSFNFFWEDFFFLNTTRVAKKRDAAGVPCLRSPELADKSQIFQI